MFKANTLKRTTELRHVDDIHINKLAQMLNVLDAWKKLMRFIPAKQISSEEFSDIGHKYKHTDIELIENASRSLTKLPAAILFDEWGTSGKVRPTLSHLLQLLIKLDLFQAADYVAVKLLKEVAPKRPGTGPAAKIDISLPEDDENDPEDTAGVEQILNDMSYPSTGVIMNENNRPDINQDFYEKRGPIDKPKLNLPAYDVSAAPVSNLLQFSLSTSDNASRPESHNTADFLPPISGLLETNNSITHNRTSPNSSYSDSFQDSAEYSDADTHLPELSIFQSEQNSSSHNIPMLSRLYDGSNTIDNNGESFNIPHISALTSDSNNSQISSFNIPNISRLQNSTSDSAHIMNNESSVITDSSIFASQSTSNLPICLDSSNFSDEQHDDNIPNISILRL